jgi:hypothetical protein
LWSVINSNRARFIFSWTINVTGHNFHRSSNLCIFCG